MYAHQYSVLLATNYWVFGGTFTGEQRYRKGCLSFRPDQLNHQQGTSRLQVQKSETIASFFNIGIAPCWQLHCSIPLSPFLLLEADHRPTNFNVITFNIFGSGQSIALFVTQQI